jgi:predicted dienelactone hydrolase
MPDRSRRRFLATAGTLAAGVLLGSAGCATPRVPGVVVVDHDWVDPLRSRAVPTRLYLPSAAPDASLPLLVFSHGIGGSREGYSYLGSYLAGAGIASMHVQHVGSDRRLWWQGAPFNVVDRLRRAAMEAEARARVDDVRFALDQALDNVYRALLDERRVYAAGHSYGANTTLLLAGARIERDGLALPLRDERVRAIMLISAPPFYGEPSPRDILSRVSVPSLHVTSTDDVIRIPGYYSDVHDRLSIYDMIGSRRKALVVFDGGSHSVFTDRSLTGGLVRNGELKRATRELVAAFLREQMQVDGDAIAEWRSRHQPLLARFEG